MATFFYVFSINLLLLIECPSACMVQKSDYHISKEAMTAYTSNDTLS